jgi:hypothetical protein
MKPKKTLEERYLAALKGYRARGMKKDALKISEKLKELKNLPTDSGKGAAFLEEKGKDSSELRTTVKGKSDKINTTEKQKTLSGSEFADKQKSREAKKATEKAKLALKNAPRADQINMMQDLARKAALDNNPNASKLQKTADLFKDKVSSGLKKAGKAGFKLTKKHIAKSKYIAPIIAAANFARSPSVKAGVDTLYSSADAAAGPVGDLMRSERVGPKKGSMGAKIESGKKLSQEDKDKLKSFAKMGTKKSKEEIAKRILENARRRKLNR